MLHLRRSVLCLALLGLVLGLASVAPAGAITATPVLGITVSVYGAGPTLADATDMALDQIRESYLILSYTTSNPLCSVIPTTGDPFCSIKVTARVVRKPVTLP